MSAFERPLRSVDRFQQRWPVLAFPIAVWKKFNDDQAGNLAALIAYYAFAALFPLLLVLATVLDIALSNNSHLRDQLINSALAQYPVIGPQINAHLGHIPGTGLPLVVGIVLLLLGARGVANAMMNALCTIWGIDRKDRPRFPISQLWAMALIFTVSIGFLATTFLSGLASGAGHWINGTLAHIGTIAVSLILNFGMFWLGFRLATAFRVRWRDLRTGAAITAVIWQVLQVAGGYVVSHQLHRSSQLYGTFGVVLGLIAWLYLQAEVTIYAAEADVVLAHREWPRQLLPDDSDKSDQSTQLSGKVDSSGDSAAPDTSAARGKQTVPGGAEHARQRQPSSLIGEPVRNDQADAGARSTVPPPRDGPAASDEHATGQR